MSHVTRTKVGNAKPKPAVNSKSPFRSSNHKSLDGRRPNKNEDKKQAKSEGVSENEKMSTPTVASTTAKLSKKALTSSSSQNKRISSSSSDIGFYGNSDSGQYKCTKTMTRSAIMPCENEEDVLVCKSVEGEYF